MMVQIALRRLEMSEQDFAAVPEDQKAALAAVSHAINELNVFKRLFLFSAVAEHPENEFGIALWIQQLTLLRSWSAKLFELQKLLEFTGSKNRTKDKVLRGIAKKAEAKFANLKDEAGYRMAREFRNEITNHIGLSSARKNLPYVTKKAVCIAYLTPEDGNCFFPIGEDFAFGGLLARLWGDLDLEPRQALDIWFGWNTKVNNWATVMHLEMLDEIIGGPSLEDTTLSLELGEEFIGDPAHKQIPMYTKTRT